MSHYEFQLYVNLTIIPFKNNLFSSVSFNFGATNFHSSLFNIFFSGCTSTVKPFDSIVIIFLLSFFIYRFSITKLNFCLFHV